MTRLATLALLALALAAQPTTAQDNPDATTTVYVARYGRWLPIQNDSLAKLPCLNANPDAILFEDHSIYCPEWGN